MVQHGIWDAPACELKWMDEESRLRELTARNVDGLEAEQRGDWDTAMALYEANLAEGFPGDWPYGRLILLLGRRNQPAEVVRVLERAVEVFAALPRSQPERGPRLRAFRERLRQARRALVETARGARGDAPTLDTE